MSAATNSQGPRPVLDVDLHGLPGLPTQRLAGALQRELATHGPIPAARVDELAAEVPDADLDELVPFLETNEAGATTVVMGLSTTPTSHEFHVQGQTLFTWCAFDAFVFAAAHGWTGQLRTRCPVTNTLIEVDLTPEAVRRTSEPEAVLVLVAPGPETPSCVNGADDVRAAFCAHMNLYRSPHAAGQAVGDDPRLSVVGLSDAHELAKTLAERVSLPPSGPASSAAADGSPAATSVAAVHDGGASCSLDAAGAVRRTAEFADLATRGLRHHRRLPDGRVELAFDAATVSADEVRALVEAEQQCCSFFTFETAADDDEIRLTVDAPASKREYLDLLTGATDPSARRSEDPH